VLKLSGIVNINHYNFLFYRNQNLGMDHRKSICAFWALLFLVSPIVSKEGTKSKDELGTVIGIDLGTTYSW